MPFLTAEWRKLAIANFSVDPDFLQPFIPPKTELDLWNGKCYISLVGFLFQNTKLRGVPIPFHRNFEEINLRFYVKFKTESGEIRRGVCFINEIVSKPALSMVARLVYHEPYITLPTSHEIKISDDEIEVNYKWKKDRWNSFKIIARNKQIEMAIGSEEEFITEHFWGYTKLKSNKTSEYPVNHPRWKVYPVKVYSIDVDFEKTYGKNFSFLNSQKPDSVLLAEGSQISVMNGRKI